MDCINLTTKVYDHRALSYIVAHYKYLPEDVNPFMILRFDVRQINDLVTFRVDECRRQHWLIAACNDGYLRVFSVAQLVMCKAIKGVSGNPICMDIAHMEGAGLQSAEGSKPRDLLAVGYEDDSFIVYSISQCFKPLFRGLGHRSFVSQIKFDNYYMTEQLRLQAEEAKNPGLSQQKQMEKRIGEKTSAVERSGSEYMKRGNTLA